MKKELQELIEIRYSRTTGTIVFKISENIRENGGQSEIDGNDLDLFICDLINNYTNAYLVYNPGERLLSLEEFEVCEKVVIEAFLQISAKSDFIPDLELVGSVSLDIVKLVTYVNSIDKE